VACEVFATTEYILIGGEITCAGKVDYEGIARGVLRDIGYTRPELGIGCDTCKIDVKVKEQSPDIAMGVNRGSLLEMGAGDQGFMFGYATNESAGYMPLAISLAHKLVRTATAQRKKRRLQRRPPRYEEPSHHRLHRSQAHQNRYDADVDSA
jgi:S-adenosylmethionine synthetase